MDLCGNETPQNESVKSAILRARFAIIELKVLVHRYVSVLAAPQVVPKELCGDTTSQLCDIKGTLPSNGAFKQKEDSKLIIFQT